MTVESKIVTDRNALIPKVLTLNVGDEFCGVVAHIQTPEDFFCQQLQSGRESIFLVCCVARKCSMRLSMPPEERTFLCLRCAFRPQTSLRSFRNPSVNTVAM